MWLTCIGTVGKSNVGNRRNVDQIPGRRGNRQRPQVLCVAGVFVGTVNHQIDLGSLVPVVAGEGPVDQRIDRVTKGCRRYALLGRFFPARQHMHFGAGKVETGNGPQLVPFRHGKLLHAHAENFLAFGNKCFQVGAGDFDVDIPARRSTHCRTGWPG